MRGIAAERNINNNGLKSGKNVESILSMQFCTKTHLVPVAKRYAPSTTRPPHHPTRIPNTSPRILGASLHA